MSPVGQKSTIVSLILFFVFIFNISSFKFKMFLMSNTVKSLPFFTNGNSPEFFAKSANVNELGELCVKEKGTSVRGEKKKLLSETARHKVV